MSSFPPREHPPGDGARDGSRESGDSPNATSLKEVYPVDADTWLVRAVDDSNGAEGTVELTVSVAYWK